MTKHVDVDMVRRSVLCSIPAVLFFPAGCVMKAGRDTKGDPRLANCTLIDDESALQFFNSAIRARPAKVIRIRSPEDAIDSFRDAGNSDQPIGIRGGGHGGGSSAVSDGAILLDTRGLKGLDINHQSLEAVVGGGVTNGELDGALSDSGLFAMTGSCPTVGYAGLAVGGGNTFLSRRYGLACDHILGAELVTPTGKVVHTDDDPDLLWAIRGAGAGNFGVVTRLRIRLFRQHPWLQSGIAMWDGESILAAMHAYEDALARAGRAFSGGFGIRAGPSSMGGLLLGAQIPDGPCSGWDHVLTTVPPSESNVKRRSHASFQSVYGASVPERVAFWWRSWFFDVGLCNDDLAETIVEHASKVPVGVVRIGVEPVDGAVQDIRPHETAFVHRRRSWLVQAVAIWSDERERGMLRDWLDRFEEAVQSLESGSSYQGYADPIATRHDEATQRRYFGENLERLWAIKRRLDPEGLVPGLIRPPA